MSEHRFSYGSSCSARSLASETIDEMSVRLAPHCRLCAAAAAAAAAQCC